MKFTFTHKDFSDKVLITLFANGDKAGSIWRTKENSLFENIKEAEEALLRRFNFENQSEEEGE